MASGFDYRYVDNNMQKEMAERVSKNPWRSDAPRCYPYVTNARNSIYNVLNYDEWKHFSNYQVIELFRVS